MNFKKHIENNLVLGREDSGEGIKNYGNGKAFQRVKKNVYLEKVYLRKPTERIWTIREIINLWGYDYSELIKFLENQIKNKENEIIILQFVFTSRILNKNDGKLILKWTVYDAEDRTNKKFGTLEFKDGKIIKHHVVRKDHMIFK